jgi:hypothetical protein
VFASLVMAGPSRPEDGVASLAYAPAITLLSRSRIALGYALLVRDFA